jgi:hypothetical protein
MVPQAFSRDVVRKYWLLHDLGKALAMRTIERVEFVDGDLHRQHVVWSGGGDVWVNRGEKDWTLRDEEFVLPQYGFMACIDDNERGLVVAGIHRVQGQVVEVAHTPDHGYFNARQLDERGAAGKPLEEIDFGAFRSGGAFRYKSDAEGKAVVFTPLPRAQGPKFVIRIDQSTRKFLKGKLFVEVVSEDGKVLRREPARREGDIVLVECEPGVFAYRLVAGG